MLNVYEFIRNDLHTNKFAIGELLFAEYICLLQGACEDIWAQTDYLVHVVNGQRTLRTFNDTLPMQTGHTIFFKKGARFIEKKNEQRLATKVSESHSEKNFCVLICFIPDHFVRDIYKNMLTDLNPSPLEAAACQSIIPVHNDVEILAFFQSMLTYFSQTSPPSEAVLQLKLKELITSILVSPNNTSLAAYFQSLFVDTSPSLVEIMESNFCYNLSLADYAKLCHRSLSSFKREFRRHFNESPGKWLLHRRLRYSSELLQKTNMAITQICFESGFEDLSHFSRAFKDMFAMTPTAFRQQVLP